MFKDTVTLFNQSGGVWYAKTLHGVDLNTDMGYLMRTLGAANAARALLHIPYRPGKKVDGFTFVMPSEFASADKSSCFTLRGGNEFSFFITGEYSGDEVTQDSAYSKGFYHHMNAQTDECYAVQSFSAYSVIPHIEVIAK